jgi:hypothetical protein
MRIFLFISGVGYLLNTKGVFFYSESDRSFLMFTFFAELISMLWLLIMKWKIRKVTKLNAVNTPV